MLFIYLTNLLSYFVYLVIKMYNKIIISTNFLHYFITSERNAKFLLMFIMRSG